MPTPITDMTEDEIQSVIETHWRYATAYFAQIIKGTYSVDEARADLQSLVDTYERRHP